MSVPPKVKKLAEFSVLEETKNGEFVRKDTVFRSWIKADNSTEFQPEPGRYHLYISNACPWANRCSAVRAMKGLEDVIGMSIVGAVFQKTVEDPEDKHRGWVFEDPNLSPGTIPDPVFGAKTLREVYERLGDTAGKYTTPLLIDTKTLRIVNNETALRARVALRFRNCSCSRC